MSTAPSPDVEIIPLETLLDRVAALRKTGYRLVQIGATRLPEQVEVTYTFDRELQVANLRLQLPTAGAVIPSITSVFWCAFLYENELHDLFNVAVTGMAVDFHGHLYETTVKFPFGTTKLPAAKPAPAAAGGAAPESKQPAAAVKT